MAQILRTQDSGSGVCYSHSVPTSVTGVIVTGATDVRVSPDGTIIAIDGSVVDLSCGHTGTLVASLTNITIDDIKVGREGDVWTDGTGNTNGVISNVGTEITES